MKKFLLIISISLLVGVSSRAAQLLPITRTLVWDASISSDPSEISYEVKLDGNLIGITTTTSIPFTITSLGQHTVSVVAKNIWGSSDPSVLTFNVSSPGKSGNIRIR